MTLKEAVLKSLEDINGLLINESVVQKKRLIKLKHIAIQQMKILHDVENRKLLK